MNIWNYTKDKIVEFCICIFAEAIIFMFLYIMGLPLHITITVIAVFMTAVLLMGVWDYGRKRIFYKNIRDSLDQLMKYLIWRKY